MPTFSRAVTDLNRAVEVPQDFNKGVYGQYIPIFSKYPATRMVMRIVAVAAVVFTLTIVGPEISLDTFFERLFTPLAKLGELFMQIPQEALIATVATLATGAAGILFVAATKKEFTLMRSDNPGQDVIYQRGKLWGHAHWRPAEYRFRDSANNEHKFLGYLNTSTLNENGSGHAPFVEEHVILQDLFAGPGAIVGAPLAAVVSMVYNVVRIPFAWLYILGSCLLGREGYKAKLLITDPIFSLARAIEAPFYGVAISLASLYSLFDPLNGRQLCLHVTWLHNSYKNMRGAYAVSQHAQRWEGGGEASRLGHRPFTIFPCRMPFASIHCTERGENGNLMIDNVLGGHKPSTNFTQISYQKTDGNIVTFKKENNVWQCAASDRQRDGVF